MASKKQGSFENQLDQGKVKKNLTSNHPKKICGKCRKLFSTWQRLKEHILRVHNIKPFTWCHLCNLEFNIPRELSKHFHLNIIHTISKPKVTPFNWCHLCYFEFSSAKELINHFKVIHTISKLERKRIDNIYICGQCGKRFSMKQNALCHFKCVHDGEKCNSL